MSTGIALLWALGFWMGYGFRYWGEVRARRHDPPAWMARLGRSVAQQFKQVDDGHKFAGKEIEFLSERPYGGGGRNFIVSVRLDPEADEAPTVPQPQPRPAV